jgi:4'-phosphopantetheinyl transferase
MATKESFIKVYQYKLAQGLGNGLFTLIPSLINIINENTASILSSTIIRLTITLFCPPSKSVIVFK